MEIQAFDSDQLLQDSARFYAVGSGSASSASGWADEGWITRVWGYSDSDSSHPIPAFPATDTPDEDWYQELCEYHEAVE
jgi:hypothetical protein